MEQDSIFQRIGGKLSSKESMIFGAIGLVIGLIFVAPWLGMAYGALCMIVGLGAGMVIGAVVHNARTQQN